MSAPRSLGAYTLPAKSIYTLLFTGAGNRGRNFTSFMKAVFFACLVL